MKMCTDPSVVTNDRTTGNGTCGFPQCTPQFATWVNEWWWATLHQVHMIGGLAPSPASGWKIMHHLSCVCVSPVPCPPMKFFWQGHITVNSAIRACMHCPSPQYCVPRFSLMTWRQHTLGARSYFSSNKMLILFWSLNQFLPKII